MLSKEASSTIFWVFGMIRPGIEPRSPGRLANALTARPMSGMYIYIYIYMYVYIYLYLFIYISIHIYLCIYTYIHIYIYTCIHIRTYIYTYMYIHTHAHTHTDIYVLIHTHTHTYMCLLCHNGCGQVVWDCRIHWLLPCWVVSPTPPNNECLLYDIKQSDGEVPVMQEL